MFSWFFRKIGLSKLASIFDPILVPTCLRFRSKNPSKLHKNWNLEGIDFLIDFCMDFLSIFLRFWIPTWSYLGPQDAPKTRPRRLQDAFKTAPKTKCVNFWFRPRLRSINVEKCRAAGGAPRDMFRTLDDFWWIFDGFSMDFRNGDFG